jgi:hypothetical protein
MLMMAVETLLKLQPCPESSLADLPKSEKWSLLDSLKWLRYQSIGPGGQGSRGDSGGPHLHGHDSAEVLRSLLRPPQQIGPRKTPLPERQEVCVDRVLKEVLWFATEVPRKYATRYRSVAAWDLQRKGKRVGDWVALSRTSMCGLARAVAFDCSPRRTPKRLRKC